MFKPGPHWPKVGDLVIYLLETVLTGVKLNKREKELCIICVIHADPFPH